MLRGANNNYRRAVAAVGYLLCDQRDLHHAFRGWRHCGRLTNRVFGAEPVDRALDRVQGYLDGLGQATMLQRPNMQHALTCGCSPAARCSRTSPGRATCWVGCGLVSATTRAATALSSSPAPHSRWGCWNACRSRRSPHGRSADRSQAGEIDVPPVWLQWTRRWFETSTLSLTTRRTTYYALIKAGRWLHAEHPDRADPASWDRALAAAWIARVDRLRVGELSKSLNANAMRARYGEGLSPRSKASLIGSLRTFFCDLQEWELIERRFDPYRGLALPRSIKALLGPDPRVIADDIWAKLMWSGLNLQREDLPVHARKLTTPASRSQAEPWYPLELVRAVALLWLFAGLRVDEILRLRVGAIRWQTTPSDGDGRVCLLDVPTNKTTSAFTKPVDRLVGEAIEAWQAVRPAQPRFPDRKTGELVDMLLAYRGAQLGQKYINRVLVPLLCAKAGVPREDVRGQITSHRARATIASQLYNAKDPMSLFELQAWLGHSNPSSTQHYARITPLTLTKAYTDAGYFARNVRAIEVLLDRDAITNGQAAGGGPFEFYDLGHGYCSYSFFEQCPHRMACARCDFYLAETLKRGAAARSQRRAATDARADPAHRRGTRRRRQRPRRRRKADRWSARYRRSRRAHPPPAHPEHQRGARAHANHRTAAALMRRHQPSGDRTPASRPDPRRPRARVSALRSRFRRLFASHATIEHLHDPRLLHAKRCQDGPDILISHEREQQITHRHLRAPALKGTRGRAHQQPEHISARRDRDPEAALPSRRLGRADRHAPTVAPRARSRHQSPHVQTPGLEHRVADLTWVDAQAAQHGDRLPLADANERKQDVLGVDVVAETDIHVQRAVEHLLGTRRERNRRLRRDPVPRPDALQDPARARSRSTLRASRTRAARPSCSRKSPSSSDSVPTWLNLRSRASVSASATAFRARSVKRSNPSTPGTRVWTSRRTLSASAPSSLQDLAGATGCADNPEQQVLGADALAPPRQRLALRHLEHVLRQRGERHLPLDRQFRTWSQSFHNQRAHRIDCDPKLAEHLGGDPVPHAEQRKQLVLGLNRPARGGARLLLGPGHDLGCLVGEADALSTPAASHSTSARATANAFPDRNDQRRRRDRGSTPPIVLADIRWIAFAQFRRPAGHVASRSQAPFPSPQLGSARRPGRHAGHVNHRIPTRREPR